MRHFSSRMLTAQFICPINQDSTQIYVSNNRSIQQHVVFTVLNTVSLQSSISLSSAQNTISDFYPLLTILLIAIVL